MLLPSVEAAALAPSYLSVPAAVSIDYVFVGSSSVRNDSELGLFSPEVYLNVETLMCFVIWEESSPRPSSSLSIKFIRYSMESC